MPNYNGPVFVMSQTRGHCSWALLIDVPIREGITQREIAGRIHTIPAKTSSQRKMQIKITPISSLEAPECFSINSVVRGERGAVVDTFPNRIQDILQAGR